MPLFGSTGKVELKSYNYDTKQVESEGEVSLWLVSKNMKLEDLCYLLDEWINCNGSSGFRTGQRMGQKFQETHRTLQGLLVNWALGILVGLAEQDPRFTDARNKTAVETAIKIKEMLERGELPLQPFI
jgi:hypothetical protein